MDLNELNSSLCFQQDENGLLYKNIDGFLYTICEKTEFAIIYVNLPEVSRNEKKMISAYIKESVLHYVKSHFVKNGVEITFNLSILEDPEYILQFAKMLSAYLSSASIEFSNAELNIAFDKTMYAFMPVEQPVENIKLRKERPNVPHYENGIQGFLSRFSTQLILITIYAVIAVIYGLISLFAIKIAGSVGYILGWLPALVMVKRNYSSKDIYTCTTIVSFFVLLISTIYVFLIYFLSQQEIYTASEFIMQSLTPAHCLFNMLLAFVLSIFGVYSTIPAKKKKTVIEDDFV
ncbi:MAG: hypothetical protein E7365_01545 [Clostridiales bacterium]|nr:hypothetical protein [Clostridiales bacterium]